MVNRLLGEMMFEAVELRELRVFLAVSEELHFGRAAERVGLTTSRVSQTIRRLEVHAGGRLLDRTSRRVSLTPLGEQLLAGLAPAYRALEQAFEQTRAAAGAVSGTLRLGMYSPLAAGPRMLEIVDAFERRHPDCKVSFVDVGWRQDEEQWLRSGQVELLAIRLPRTVPGLVIGPVLSHEPRVLLVRRDDPLAQRESVRVADFRDRTIADVPQLSREMVDAFLPGWAVHKRRDVHSTLEVLMLVASGEIVHPTVPSYVVFHPHPATVAIPIEDLPPSETALAWLADRATQAVRAFAQTAADVLAREAPPTVSEPAPDRPPDAGTAC